MSRTAATRRQQVWKCCKEGPIEDGRIPYCTARSIDEVDLHGRASYHVSNYGSPAEENVFYQVYHALIFTRSVFGAGFFIPTHINCRRRKKWLR